MTGISQHSCELKLLVQAKLAPAIIGKGGSAVRSIKSQSGVHAIHLSQNDPELNDRTICITGPTKALVTAFDIIAGVLRTEARLKPGSEESVRVLLPNANSLTCDAAIRKVGRSSGALVSLQPVGKGSAATRERLVTCVGSADQTKRAVQILVCAIARRHELRHRGFLSQWAFETNYNDHFETSESAYSDITPVLRRVALQRLGSTHRTRKKRKRAEANSPEIGDRVARRLVLYDPYYCQGHMRDALSAFGFCRERIINENRDFYADIAEGRVPTYDALVTNPPYSADHKLRLLHFLLGICEPESHRQNCKCHQPHDPHHRRQQDSSMSYQTQQPPLALPTHARGPFFLLMPAWLASTDYWLEFLRKLAAHRLAPANAESTDSGSCGKLERLAGVFYISPSERYSFAHPQATGHAASPFHAIWYCGGWPTEADRAEAMSTLKPLRRAGKLEVFRSADMLQKRGHFSPGSALKKAVVSPNSRHGQ